MPIKIRPGVIMTPAITNALPYIEKHLPADFTMWVTSGKRPATEQLHLIADYAQQHNIAYPEFNRNDVESKTIKDGEEIYCWQRTWSALLAMHGVIINPPKPAAMLFDYVITDSMGKKINRKGHVYPATNHTTGNCFDSSTRDESPLDEVKIISGAIAAAIKDGAPITGYRIERKQNCIHTDCKPYKVSRVRLAGARTA